MPPSRKKTVVVAMMVDVLRRVGATGGSALSTLIHFRGVQPDSSFAVLKSAAEGVVQTLLSFSRCTTLYCTHVVCLVVGFRHSRASSSCSVCCSARLGPGQEIFLRLQSRMRLCSVVISFVQFRDWFPASLHLRMIVGPSPKRGL